MKKSTAQKILWAIMGISYVGICVIIGLFIYIIIDVATAHSQNTTTPPATADFESSPASQEALVYSVLEKLEVWENEKSGKVVYAYKCRAAPKGCEKRIKALISYIYTSCKKHDLNPYLAAAVAWKESRFNPFALSQTNDVGTFQINRYSPWAKGVRFIKDRRFRRSCRNKVGACQQLLIDRAVKLLRDSIDHCNGIRSGLGMYNTGKCNGNPAYTRRVLRTYYTFSRIANTTIK